MCWAGGRCAAFVTHLISMHGSDLQRDIPFHSAGNSGLERKVTDNLS